MVNLTNGSYVTKMLKVLSLFFLLMFGSSAYAASCKGKSHSSCSASKNCTWVNAYKRSDGVKVSSHCRAVSGKGASKDSKAKSTSKSNKKKSDKAKSKKDKSKKDKGKSKKKGDKGGRG